MHMHIDFNEKWPLYSWMQSLQNGIQFKTIPTSNTENGDFKHNDFLSIYITVLPAVHVFWGGCDAGGSWGLGQLAPNVAKHHWAGPDPSQHRVALISFSIQWPQASKKQNDGYRACMGVCSNFFGHQCVYIAAQHDFLNVWRDITKSRVIWRTKRWLLCLN